MLEALWFTINGVFHWLIKDNKIISQLIGLKQSETETGSRSSWYQQDFCQKDK